MRYHKHAPSAVGIAQCSLFVALMVAGAYVKIPFPTVPLTFQTALAVLCGLTLGVRKGIIAMSAYMLLGLVGFPAFAGGGGLHYVYMPSFGYILGFILSAAVAGTVSNKKTKLWVLIAVSLAATLADYVIGVAYFIAVWEINGYEGLFSAVITYNLVYVPKDIVLGLAAAFVSSSVLPAIKKSKKNR